MTSIATIESKNLMNRKTETETTELRNTVAVFLDVSTLFFEILDCLLELTSPGPANQYSYSMPALPHGGHIVQQLTMRAREEAEQIAMIRLPEMWERDAEIVYAPPAPRVRKLNILSLGE